MNDVFQRIGAFKIVPIVTLDSPDDIVPLADALTEGGIPVLEVTFRTSAAAAALSKLAKQRPDVLIGAGTLLTTDDLKKAVDSGARFGLAPGLNGAIVREAQRIGFPFVPGVLTPSEVDAGVNLGLKVLKYFPAQTAGGVALLKSIVAPFAHTGIRFIPTGGISAENAPSYLALQEVLAVGGAWPSPSEDIRAKNWRKITAVCKEAMARIKGQGPKGVG